MYKFIQTRILLQIDNTVTNNNRLGIFITMWFDATQ